MTFHGEERMESHIRAHLKESPWVVWLPLVALAIPSVILGYILIGPILFDQPSLLANAVYVLPTHNVLAEIGHHYEGPGTLFFEAFYSPIFYLVIAGIVVAWVCYSWKPEIPGIIAQRFSLIYRILLNKYGLDDFNDWAFVRGTRSLSNILFRVGDKVLIDGVVVNGSGLAVRWLAICSHVAQSGYIYHYAATMVVALLVLIVWLLLG